MKKLDKRDYFNIGILIVIFLIIVLVLTRFKYNYGSSIDWNTQHWAIPEYFRTMFYHTKNLLPSFAFNIGAGQNIYNLSYYGFLNPLFLISYLLPFIKMITYIQILGILSVITSTVMIYIWIKSKYDSKIAFISSFIFLLASPVIFHSHRHIMFMDYLPFTILGLMSIDKYFKDQKKSLLIISTFLVCMTSYFYSIGSIFTFIIYYIYLYLKTNIKFSMKDFIKKSIKFIYPIVIGVLMAMVLLLPTFYAILAGRSTTNVHFDWLELIIPNINVKGFVYNSYGLGLTGLFIYSLVENIIFGKKNEKFLSIIFGSIATFPIIIFILNGGMYIDGKVLIPLLPICILLISKSIYRLLNEEHNYKLVSISTLILGIVLLFNFEYKLFLITDIILVISMFLISKRFKRRYLVLIPLLLVCLLSSLIVNNADKLVPLSKNKRNDTAISLINDTLSKDKSFYRIANISDTLDTANQVNNPNMYTTTIYSSVSNSYYKDFYYNLIGNEIKERSVGQLSAVKNIYFNIYMGNKYLISTDSNIMGYTKINSLDNTNVFVNENVFSIGYSSNKLMSIKEYKTLKYPYNVEVLLKYIIVSEDVISNYSSTMVKEPLKYEVLNKENVNIEEIDNTYNINALDKAKLNIKLDGALKDKIIMIRFDITKDTVCSFGDISITINKMTNKLTCHEWKYNNHNTSFEYTLASVPTNLLDISFSNGKYALSNIEIYTWDIKDIEQLNINHSVLKVDTINDDSIYGTIDVKEDGYFVLNIPYDKGFSIYVDDEKTKYQNINIDFMGFKVLKGTHNIKIVYTSPLQKEGKLLSLVGIILFMGISYIEISPNKKKR